VTCHRLAVAAFVLILATGRSEARGVRGLPPGEVPVAVTIGAYLIDLVEIDEATLSYKLSGYLTLEWRDSRLGAERAPGIDRDSLTLDQIWHPNIELSNEYSERVSNNRQITVDAEGLVRFEERFEAQLGTQFDLLKFPFDRQTLLMGVESFRYDTGLLQLSLRQDHDLKSPSAFLPDWYILDVRQRILEDRNNPERRAYSQYLFETDVRRKVGYYVWNVFLPLGFIALLPWTLFWIEPSDVRTRVSITMTALLTAIALSLVITGARPRVSYMTFFDALFLNSYLLIFLSTITVVAEHFIQRRALPAALAARASSLGRIAYPALLVVSNVVLILVFLR
jgi:hypothetical protein